MRMQKLGSCQSVIQTFESERINELVLDWSVFSFATSVPPEKAFFTNMDIIIHFQNLFCGVECLFMRFESSVTDGNAS